MSGPRRILVRLPTWVGDAVMATPALRALRQAFPEARIVAEGRPALAPLLRGLPSFDAFLEDPGRGAAALARRTRALRREHFDWAVLLPDSVRAAAAPFLAGVPLRAGFAREPLRRALLTHGLAVPRAAGRRLPLPNVERYLRITRSLGCADRGGHPELRVAPDADDRAAERLRRAGLDADAGILLVAPGAGFGPSKRWPPGHFARAADGIARELGLRPLVAAAPDELELSSRVARLSRTGAVALGEAIALDELAALVARSRLLLTNDTGPRHVAAALGTPVVVAMGPTHPAHGDSGFADERVLRRGLACSPCQRRRCPIDHRCLTGLAPGLAVAAARELLAARA